MKKSANISVPAIIAILLMCFSLLLLTGSNFIIYPQAGSSCTSLIHSGNSNDEESQAPIEEKASSKTGLTIQEEYIHELHARQNLSAFVVLQKHKIPSTEKLQIVHFELDVPPPKA